MAINLTDRLTDWLNHFYLLTRNLSPKWKRNFAEKGKREKKYCVRHPLRSDLYLFRSFYFLNDFTPGILVPKIIEHTFISLVYCWEYSRPFNDYTKLFNCKKRLFRLRDRRTNQANWTHHPYKLNYMTWHEISRSRNRNKY